MRRDDPASQNARVSMRREVRTAPLVPLDAGLAPRRCDRRHEDSGRLHAVRHLVRVGVEVREELLSLVASPKLRVAGTGPAPAALMSPRDQPAAARTWAELGAGISCKSTRTSRSRHLAG